MGSQGVRFCPDSMVPDCQRLVLSTSAGYRRRASRAWPVGGNSLHRASVVECASHGIQASPAFTGFVRPESRGYPVWGFYEGIRSRYLHDHTGLLGAVEVHGNRQGMARHMGGLGGSPERAVSLPKRMFCVCPHSCFGSSYSSLSVVEALGATFGGWGASRLVAAALFGDVLGRVVMAGNR